MFNLIDQGLFSGANFLMNILLARWFTPDEYGSFSIAFSILIFVSIFPVALFIEPVAVYAGRKYLDDLFSYLGVQIKYQTILMVGLGIVLLIAAFVISGAVQKALFGLSLGLPFIFLIWFFRRACYIETQPYLAAQTSVTYAALVLVGIFVLRGKDLLSPFSAFIVMALGSAAASVIPLRRLNVKIPDSSEWKGSWNPTGVLKENWNYGKWILAAMGANWIASLAYVPLIGAFVGLAEAAAFKSIQNLILPLQQAFGAVYLMLLPWLSKRVALEGHGWMKRVMRLVLIMLSLIVIVYIVFLQFFARQIVSFVYENDYYVSFVWLLPLLGFAFLITAISNTIGTFLRAMERPQAILWAKTIAALVVVTFGIWCIIEWGLLGVAFTLILSSITDTSLLIWNYLVLMKAPEKVATE